jgi:nitrogen fixation/metabolism regulation signal transduction histidine kinase
LTSSGFNQGQQLMEKEDKIALMTGRKIGQVLLNLLVNAAHTITEKLNRSKDGSQGRTTIKTGVE